MRAAFYLEIAIVALQRLLASRLACLVLGNPIRQSEHHRNVLFGFHRLSPENCLRIAPLANRIHCRRHKQRRAAHGNQAMHGPFAVENGVHLDCAFDALLSGFLWINRLNARKQTPHLQAFPLARFFRVFRLGYANRGVGIETDRHQWCSRHRSVRLLRWRRHGWFLFFHFEGRCSFVMDRRSAQ